MPTVSKPPKTPKQRGRASKAKGSRLEVEFAAKVGGEVVRFSGARGGVDSCDVIQPELGEDKSWRYEVKGRASALKTLYDWLQRKMSSGVDSVVYSNGATTLVDGGAGRMRPPQAVAYRADNSNWLVCIPLDEWIPIMNRLIIAEREMHNNSLDLAMDVLRRAKV